MEIYHPRDDELLREMRRVRREKKRKRILWGSLITLVLCAVTGWLALNHLFMLAEMRGPAMGDSLPEGSLTLVSRTGIEEIGRGDLILYETDDGYQIKRVTALGGDNIVVSPYSGVRINGAVQDSDLMTGRHADAGTGIRRLTVPEGEYFVQGDLVSLSTDSRDREYGTVSGERVIGKVKFILWPASRLGEPVTGGFEQTAGDGGSERQGDEE